MQPSRTLGRLTDEEWRELNARADQFAAVTADNPDADWEALLAGLSPGLRYAVLIEFLKIALHEGWARGRTPVLADFLFRFREFDDPRRIPAHLIVEEVRVRKAHGDPFDADEYIRRYPDHLSEIKELMKGAETATPRTVADAVGESVSMPREPSSDTQLTAAGNYSMHQELGRGQFGKVYKAVAPGGVDVAIKVIARAADGNEARKERGALQLVKNIRHPHLLPVLAYWEKDNNLYIVMELADGTLGDRLKSATPGQKTPMEKATLVKIIGEAATALDFLHAKNLLHRDIKPANILLVNDFAKLADFGLARTQNPTATAGTFAGTPAYMAPEAWAGRFGPASDQYSLALSYAELRFGKRLIDGDDFVAVMTQHLEHIPEMPGLPAKEQAALRRALAKKPEDRFPTCVDFAKALLDEPHPHPRPRPVLIGMAVAAVAVAGYFAWPFLMGTKTGPTPSTSTVKKEESTAAAGTEPTKIGIPPKKTWLAPAGFTVVLGESAVRIGDKEYPKNIHREFGGSVMRFLLVEPRAGGPVTRPFYAMEQKATNAMVGQFAKADPAALAATKWAAANNLAPAMNLTVTEAAAVARWLGGRLPTPAEWDTLAGFYEPNRPAKITVEGQPAVGLPAPRADSTDWNALTANDMAGNGREFTGHVLLPDGKTRPLKDAEDARALVILRGRLHTTARALTWADIEAEQKTPQTQFFEKPSPYTTFRVAVDVP